MFKTGDDLRQDQLIIGMVCTFVDLLLQLRLIDSLWKREHLDLCLTPYPVLATSVDSGLLNSPVHIHSLITRNVAPCPWYPRVSWSSSKTQKRSSKVSPVCLLSSFIVSSELKPSPSSPLGISPEIMENYIRSCGLFFCSVTSFSWLCCYHLHFGSWRQTSWQSSHCQ